MSQVDRLHAPPATDADRLHTCLRERARRYEILLASIEQGYCVIEVLFDDTGTANDYRFLEVNDAFERHTGLVNATGKRMRELEPRHEGHWFEIYGRVTRTGRAERFVQEARHLGARWYDVNAFPIPGDGCTHVGVLFTDISERKRLEQQLRHQELMIREAAEMAHVGGWSFDPVNGIGDWTEETARIHGLDGHTSYAVALGLGHYEGENRARLETAVQAATENGTPFDLELDFVDATGEKKRVRTMGRPVVEDGKVVRVRGSFQDVTERHRLEEQIRRGHRMEAFGQLAGGVAHDFNNMLQVIGGYAALLLDRLPAGDPSMRLVAEIQKAGERSAALTRQLLAFARQQVVAPKVLDPSAAAADTTGMLRRLIGEDVRLVTDLPPGVWPVLIDAGQLEQVLLNLAVNARDAMPAGGTLTVSTRNETLDATAHHPDASPGPHAVLCVTDTGTGMTDAVMARIFEPFFTTKGVGQGTGLGLATVYGIVKQASGHLRVRSQPGAGSTFEVYLPRAARPVECERAGPRTLPRGTETVLVVEDEGAVRALVRVVLAGCGYNVLEAAEAEEARQVSAEHLGPIHLLLSDVVMPGGGGRVAAASVLTRHPQARVMFMSGYTDDAVVRYGVREVDVPFLQKPFTPTVLAVKVRQVLDAAH